MNSSTKRSGRIKLLILVPSMELGGLERCTSMLLKHFRRELFDLELAMIFDRQSFFEIPVDVRVHVLEKMTRAKDTEPDVQLASTLPRKYRDGLTWLEGTARNLAMLVHAVRPDAILAQDICATTIALIAKKYIRVPTKIVGSIHIVCSDFLQLVDFGELYVHLLRRHLKEADAVVAVGKGVADDLTVNFGVKPNQMRVIYNPFDFEEVEKSSHENLKEHSFLRDETPTVLFVGRLTLQKGLVYLLRAIALTRKLQKARFLVVGEGEQRSELEALAEQLGLSAEVSFLGRQDNVFKYMRSVTCLVLPSLVEAVPYTVLEAMACGCPVIASESGPDVRELLRDGQAGVLVPPRNPYALAEAILRIMRDKKLRDELIEAGIQHVKQFSPARSVAQYEELVKSVAGF